MSENDEGGPAVEPAPAPGTQPGSEPVAAPVGAPGEPDLEWPELEVPPPPAIRRSARRPIAVALAAALLVIGGVGGLANAFLTPFLPEALANVAPVLTGIIGLGGLAAALGVWRMKELGRLLGLGVALGWLIRDALLTQTALALGLDPLRGRAPDPFFDWVLPLGMDLAILAALALGWRRQARED